MIFQFFILYPLSYSITPSSTVFIRKRSINRRQVSQILNSEFMPICQLPSVIFRQASLTKTVVQMAQAEKYDRNHHFCRYVFQFPRHGKHEAINRDHVYFPIFSECCAWFTRFVWTTASGKYLTTEWNRKNDVPLHHMS